ncbi:MAG: DUF1684 domain-containing protein [Bacteroidota bacterium]
MTVRLALAVLVAGLASGPVLGLAGCAAPEAESGLDHARLAEAWTEWVARRDSLFRTPASPLPPEARETFDGLLYFAYDSTLAVPAALVPPLAPDTVAFPTTTGELRPMVAAGHLVFEADGVQWRLEAFEPLGPLPGRLFVPFRDATSGTETYGGGRYLDLEVTDSGQYALDFNRAYHPYCVYDVTWVCPLPPPENTIELAVTAGERFPEAEG